MVGVQIHNWGSGLGLCALGFRVMIWVESALGFRFLLQARVFIWGSNMGMVCIEIWSPRVGSLSQALVSFGGHGC